MFELPPTLPTLPLIAWMAALTAKHMVADFLLQNKWMAYGKGAQRNWLVPLTVHAGAHGVLTAALIAAMAPRFAWLGLVDFAIHCVVDRGKGVVSRMVGATPERNCFWWLIGLDQALHHLTDFAFSLCLAAWI